MKFKAILVATMSRSGHHAVIHWMGCQSPVLTHYFNNGKSNWAESHLIMGSQADMWAFDGSGQATHLEISDDIRLGNYGNNWRIFSFEQLRLDPFPDKDFLRDLHRKEFSHKRYLPGLLAFQEFSDCATDELLILIISRDPLNWLASKWKHAQRYSKRDDWRDTGMGEHPIYWQHATYTNSTLYGRPCLNIRYNLWFSSRAYRDQICRTIGLNEGDQGLDYVPEYGDSSSFDKLNYQGSARQMHTLERYKQIEDPLFWRMVNDWLGKPDGLDQWGLDDCEKHFGIRYDRDFLVKRGVERSLLG